MNADELQGFLFVLAMAVVFGRSWQLSRAERKIAELNDTIDTLKYRLQIIHRIYPTARVRVCGIECKPGDEHCNGYCTGKADSAPPLEKA